MLDEPLSGGVERVEEAHLSFGEEEHGALWQHLESVATLYVPEAVYVGGALQFGARLAVSDAGLVLADAGPGAKVVHLPGKVLLPGLVNAHSHAFQRVLRGRTEHLDAGRGRDDFWSWREAMYAAAAALGPDELYLVSRQAFLEMALSGITTVGEFHYLHHGPDGTPYEDPQELALQVMRAASDVGLRLVLLRTAYARAGFQRELDARQRRFVDGDLDEVLARVADLKARATGLCTVGLAPHSVRAVPRAWLERAAALWRVPDGPLHLHAAEQPAEVRACRAEHGLSPVELLDEVGLLREGTTLVHAIHLEPSEPARLGRAGVNVCACPSTERNLGDGVVLADELLAAGVRLALGSDSQAQIDLLDEARQLEGHLRLLRLRRNVLAPASARPDALAQRLLELATQGGARSLGLSVGTLDPGRPADFFTVARSHPALLGAPDTSLLASIMFAAPPGAVRDVAVQGRLIVADGAHVRGPERRADFADDFAAVIARLEVP